MHSNLFSFKQKEIDIKTNNYNYDVVIPVAKKDYVKLPYIINSFKYLKPQPEGIYIISQDNTVKKIKSNYDIKYFIDEDILPLEYRDSIKYRPYWVYQQFIVLLQNVTKNDFYFECMADNFFLKPIELFSLSGKPKFFISPQHSHIHDQYFNFQKNVYGIDRFNHPNGTLNSSFIIDFIMYNKNICKKILKNHANLESFMQEMASSISDHAYPGDQELYANISNHYYPNFYEIEYGIKTILSGSHNYIDNNMFCQFYNEIKKTDAVSCSYNTWKNANEEL